MNIHEAERYLTQELKKVYDEHEALNIAAMIMESLSGAGKAERLSRKDEFLSDEQARKLQAFLPRLLQHEPVQYLVGSTWFYGLELFVNPAVLIPRPETEELVDWIVKDMAALGKDVFHRGAMEADETKKLKILDVGTGSGCIALALKKAMPKAEVWGCDLSEEALNVARRNGSALDIRVDFQGVDFLDPAQQRSLPTVDIVVSNPPYVPQSDRATMHPNVLNFEPHEALFVPDNDALIFYKALAGFAERRLYEKGSMYMEIHENLGKEVTALFEANGFNVELRKDMQGKDRMVKVTRDKMSNEIM
jgi:release factor glutamine methyltransferase